MKWWLLSLALILGGCAASEESPRVSQITCYSAGKVIYQGPGTQVERKETNYLYFYEKDSGDEYSIRADCIVVKTP
jgi:hypothetical protein